LAGVISDETGTGALTFATGPTFSVPNILDYIQWTSTTAALSTGRQSYDSGEDALVFSDSTTATMFLGHDLIMHVRNQTGSTISKGQVVYASGGTAAGIPLVQLAQANSEAVITSTLGVAKEDIANNSFGMVARSGIVKNFDTSAWTVGTLLYVSASTPGALTSTKPTNPNFAWQIGLVTKQNATSGRMIAFSHSEYVDDTAVVFSDNTTGDVSTSMHGYVPKAPGTNTVLTGNSGTWTTVPNAALANSTITLNAGTSTGYTAPGAMTLGNTYTFGSTSDTIRMLRLGLGQAPDSTASVSLTQNSLGAVQTDGVILKNTTAADGTTTTQWSPALHFIGQAWKSNATTGSQQMEWVIEDKPITAGNVPKNALRLQPINNGSAGFPIDFCGQPSGSTAIALVLDGSGCDLNNSSAGFGFVNAGNIFGMFSNGSENMIFHNQGITFGNSHMVAWASGSTPGNTKNGDTGLARSAPGVVEVNNTTAGTFRDIAVRNALLEGTTSGVLTLTTPATTTSYTLTLPSSGGTANYAMTTDGSGTASWVSGQSIAGLLTSSTPQFARIGMGGAADAIALIDLNQSGTGNSDIAFENVASLADNSYVAHWIGKDQSTNKKSAAILYNLGTSGASYADSYVAILHRGDSPASGGFLVKTGGRIFAPGASAASAATAADACFSTGGEIVNDSALCIVSASRFKHDVTDIAFGSKASKMINVDAIVAPVSALDADVVATPVLVLNDAQAVLKDVLETTMPTAATATDLLNGLRPVSYYLNEASDFNQARQQFGFIAEEVAAVDDRLVTYQSDGQIRSVLYISLIPILTKGFQEQAVRISALEARIAALEAK
jgi:hypothetical protein